MTANEAYELAVKSYYEHCLEEVLLDVRLAAEQGKLNIDYSYGEFGKNFPAESVYCLIETLKCWNYGVEDNPENYYMTIDWEREAVTFEENGEPSLDILLYVNRQ